MGVNRDQGLLAALLLTGFAEVTKLALLAVLRKKKKHQAAMKKNQEMWCRICIPGVNHPEVVASI